MRLTMTEVKWMEEEAIEDWSEMKEDRYIGRPTDDGMRRKLFKGRFVEIKELQIDMNMLA